MNLKVQYFQSQATEKGHRPGIMMPSFDLILCLKPPEEGCHNIGKHEKSKQAQLKKNSQESHSPTLAEETPPWSGDLEAQPNLLNKTNLTS